MFLPPPISSLHLDLETQSVSLHFSLLFSRPSPSIHRSAPTAISHRPLPPSHHPSYVILSPPSRIHGWISLLLSVDYERSKIDNEVEWLGEGLRIVQEGREKLNFLVGHRERVRIQLHLLEDIANQLREIRQ